MNNQIKLNDGETLTWAIYENGSGILSLVLYAETITNARPVAAVFDILPWDVKPALADLDMIHMWEAGRPVAYNAVSHTGAVETVIEQERMGYTAKWAFGLESAVC